MGPCPSWNPERCMSALRASGVFFTEYCGKGKRVDLGPCCTCLFPPLYPSAGSIISSWLAKHEEGSAGGVGVVGMVYGDVDEESMGNPV